MHEYDYADFGSEREEPSVTPRRLATVAKRFGLRLSVWLEELDKFNPTQGRLNYLIQLVDAIDELGGTLITSTNETPAVLTERLGEPIVRRLTEADLLRGMRS